jgi:hypothetical protein
MESVIERLTDIVDRGVSAKRSEYAIRLMPLDLCNWDSRQINELLLLHHSVLDPTGDPLKSQQRVAALL